MHRAKRLGTPRKSSSTIDPRGKPAERQGAYRLPSEDRVRRRADYRLIQGSGRPVHTRHFLIVVFARTGQARPRLGITVTKKVSRSAVRRNRVKRVVREVFRTHRDLFPPADCVVIAKRGAPDLGYREVSDEFRGAARNMKRASARGIG
ncbi:MAG: ribonuclease P protein component [Myxococcota bacterium]